MTPNKDGTDAVISELYRTREALVDKFGGDLAALTADAQRRQLASGRTIIRRGNRVGTAVRPTAQA